MKVPSQPLPKEEEKFSTSNSPLIKREKEPFKGSPFNSAAITVNRFNSRQTAKLSQQHEIYFQWIPSHIGLFGNDTADLLAKEGVTEDLMSRKTLTFSEIFSETKSLIQELWPQVVPFPSRWIESSKQLLVRLRVDTLDAFPFT
ncbi:hypothetical protein TNCV_2775141 [Trichonephila clavipes]|nr:hypothetical protein TNCV_2775141 [Trichonephila clavipes]